MDLALWLMVVFNIPIYDPKGGQYINVYQKMWSRATAEVVRAERCKVWDAIAECVDRIPAQNQVLLMGDMNVQLPFAQGITGTSVTTHKYRDGRMRQSCSAFFDNMG